MFVFEERVPQTYQAALQTPLKKRTIFKRFPRHSEPKTSEQRREEDFDMRLKRHLSTRVVSAGKLQTSQIGAPLPASPPAPKAVNTSQRTSVGTDGSPRRHRQQEASPRTSDGSPRPKFLDRVGMACAGRMESSDTLKDGTRLMSLGPSCPTRVHDSFKVGESGRWICESCGCVAGCR